MSYFDPTRDPLAVGEQPAAAGGDAAVTQETGRAADVNVGKAKARKAPPTKAKTKAPPAKAKTKALIKKPPAAAERNGASTDPLAGSVVTAKPTKENVKLLTAVMLGLTFMILVFAGVLIVARRDLNLWLIVSVTAALVCVADAMVLSIFTVGKGSRRRLYKLRKALKYLFDPDAKELL